VLHCAFHWSEDGLCLGAAMTDTTGEMLETFSALFPGVGQQNAPDNEGKARDAASRGMIAKLWASVEEWLRRCYKAKARVVIASLGVCVPKDLEDWREILESAKVGSEGSPCGEAHVVQVAVLRALQLLSTEVGSGGALSVDTWPFPPQRVNNVEMSSALASPSPSFLLRSQHRFCFPPFLSPPTIPRATCVVVSAPTRDEEETCSPGLDTAGLWPTLLEMSLHFSVPQAKQEGANSDKDLIAQISKEYHALSWATAHPCFPMRQSVLPLHIIVAKRVALAASAVV